MKIIITVKSYALAKLIAVFIKKEFDKPEITINSSSEFVGHEIWVECNDERIDALAYFAKGIVAAVGALFVA